MTKSQAPLIHLSSLLKNNKGWWLISFLLGFILFFSTLGLLSVSGWFITISAVSGLLQVPINYLLYSGLIRAFALLKIVTRYGGDLVTHNSVLYLLRDLRVQILELLSHRYSKVAKQRNNSIIFMNRLIADINILNFFPLQVILPFVIGFCIITLFLVFIFFINIYLFWLLLIGALISWLVIPVLSIKRALDLAEHDITLAEAYKVNFIQRLSLLTSLLVWNTWDTQQERIDLLNNQRLVANLKIKNFGSLTTLFQSLSLSYMLIATLCIGVQLVIQEQISVAILLAILLTILGLSELILTFAKNSISLAYSIQAKNRINDLANTVALDIPRQPFTDKVIAISAIDVSTKMPDAINGPKHINFNLHLGDFLVLKGASGIGKSTLLEALTGSIPLQHGKIIINGTAITNPDSIEDIAYLQQQIDIFDMSLADNLRIAKADATDQELWHAIDFVNLKSWALSRDGLATQLGEYGTNISGGQARRIALARVILANQTLILLDEPFAGLDADTTQLLFSRLLQYAQQHIIILVSHYDLPKHSIKEYIVQ